MRAPTKPPRGMRLGPTDYVDARDRVDGAIDISVVLTTPKQVRRLAAWLLRVADWMESRR